MKTISLTKGEIALVDDEDYEWLSQWKWCLGNDGYATREERVDGKRKRVFMHRLINNTSMGFDTDHIDRNRLNNCRSNLRTATRSQNRANSKKQSYVKGEPCSSRFKGVTWYKARSKWLAQTKVEGVKKYLGLFQSEQEAAETYDRHARYHFGEYAKLNFEEETPLVLG